jgi:hypothetical protein
MVSALVSALIFALVFAQRLGRQNSCHGQRRTPEEVIVQMPGITARCSLTASTQHSGFSQQWQHLAFGHSGPLLAFLPGLGE